MGDPSLKKIRKGTANKKKKKKKSNRNKVEGKEMGEMCTLKLEDEEKV